MAQNIYVVKKGDTLSEIAQKYGIGDGDWMKGARIIAENNGIANIDYIVVGQKIRLYGVGEDPVKSIDAKYRKVSWKTFGMLSGSKNLYVAWAWNDPKDSKGNVIGKTAQFEVKWEWWAPGMKAWETGVQTEILLYDQETGAALKPAYHSLYGGYPDNARRVKVSITPKYFKTFGSNWSDNYKANNIAVCGTNTTDPYDFADAPPEVPSSPHVELKNLKITASLSDLDPEWESNGTQIEFWLVANNATVAAKTTSTISTGYASAEWDAPKVVPGTQYKVKCRAVRTLDEGDTLKSDWSGYSSNFNTRPEGVPKITKCQASKTADGSNDVCVYLEWKAVNTADSYTVQYATNESDFEYNAATESSGIENTKFKTPAISEGGTYYFRVRASNSNGDTEWSEIVSVTVGDVPAAPTTWASSTSVVAGKPVTMYWIHNARDNSDETFAELETWVNGVKQLAIEIKNEDIGAETDGISSYVFETNANDDGVVLRWRVRTAGVTKEFGDWSEERIINIYQNPSLTLSLTNRNGEIVGEGVPVTAFPLFVNGLASPSTQVPIGYHISIVSNQAYETPDATGNLKTINAGEEIYSQFFDISDPLLAELSASNVDLADRCNYTLKCTVTMDTGLDAEATVNFDVSWTDEDRWPNAEVSINHDDLTAYIKPYCEGLRTEYREVAVNELYNGRIEYVTTPYTLAIPEDPMAIECTLDKTTTGETVYTFVHEESGATIRFCRVTYIKTNDDVLLSVYRREFDGTFTELATGIDPAMNTHVVDPHPALDFARYRVVSVQQGTGAISYLDIPAVEVGEKAIVIQWNEAWTSFDTSSASILTEPPWSGSLLKLPYNIDISDSYGTDNSLIKYIGRKYPVSYYGTHLESSSTWNVEIPKYDKETLHAIRRLAVWTGDVYVREPSGTGYWASISVSYSQKHCELTIPITLNVKRVEGGV